MTLSLVVLACTLSTEMAEMTNRCLESYKDKCDELIVVEDGPLPIDYASADTVICHRENQGFTKSANDGWRVARGEYVAIINNDTEWVSGDLYNLCVPARVTSPRVIDATDRQELGRPPGILHGAFFVTHNPVANLYGRLDERLHTYYSDTDFAKRVQEIYRDVPSVTIRHRGKVTTDAMGIQKSAFARDGKIFGEIWSDPQASYRAVPR